MSTGMKAKWLANDFEARLNAGVICLGGIPFKAEAGAGVIHLRDIVTNKLIHQNVDPHHPDLDCGSVPLGFINAGEDGAIYMQRIPSRRYKQSLEERSIKEVRLTSGGFVADIPEGSSKYLYTKYFVQSFRKTYPTLEEAYKMLKDGTPSVAISRDAAVTKNNLDVMNIWYKLDDNPVGWIDFPRSRTIRVPSSEKAWIISMYLHDFGWEID